VRVVSRNFVHEQRSVSRGFVHRRSFSRRLRIRIDNAARLTIRAIPRSLRLPSRSSDTNKDNSLLERLCCWRSSASCVNLLPGARVRSRPKRTSQKSRFIVVSLLMERSCHVRKFAFERAKILLKTEEDIGDANAFYLYNINNAR